MMVVLLALTAVLAIVLRHVTVLVIQLAKERQRQHLAHHVQTHALADVVRPVTQLAKERQKQRIAHHVQVRVLLDALLHVKDNVKILVEDAGEIVMVNVQVHARDVQAVVQVAVEELVIRVANLVAKGIALVVVNSIVLY